MKNISNRQFRIVIFDIYILIIIQIIFANTFLFDFMADNFTDKKELIYQITYAWIYISILMLIRKITYETVIIKKYLFWVIKFETLKVLCHIIISLNIFSYASIFALLIELILLIIYIILVITILNKKYNNSIEISKLRSFAIASIVIVIITLLSVTYIVFNNKYKLYWIIYLISTIPFVFLIGYLKTMKSINKKLQINNNI